ncbi:L-dopachrome tautomerase-related protein [Roseateles terrae]|uniref:Sugar lactone lactonase YvrE n=1 Tax=Roseateles terrae TaxID=431060 RepID=A0ABR6GYS3_9BURK|nr:L-dopachrome tautomerase-related protein [Roseateles terrae]MBB3196797.1 sugar lactone lactonase YvrE [Roseateles terrae]
MFTAIQTKAGPHAGRAGHPRSGSTRTSHQRFIRSLREALQMAALGTALALVTGVAQAQTPSSAPVANQPAQTRAVAHRIGDLEVVAELPIRPGNVAPAAGGRVFATVHPLGAPAAAQLIEITGRSSYRPWPSAAFQRGTQAPSDDRIDSPLGLQADHRGHLWVIDMGLQLGKTRLWSFDIRSGQQVKRLELPADIAPKGSFVQDLAIDADGGWAYLADIANPGLIAVNTTTGEARRFSGHASLQADPQARMSIGGKDIQFQGTPAQVGVNPITLSADRKTVFFGAMNGQHWYEVPAALLHPGVSDSQTAAAIRIIGDKPVSDGAATTKDGRHFFTNLNESGIDQLDARGRLTPVVRDPRLDWPDSVHHFDGGWLYVSVNQLYRTPAFTGGADEGKPPYRVMRVWIGTADRR